MSQQNTVFHETLFRQSKRKLTDSLEKKGMNSLKKIPVVGTKKK